MSTDALVALIAVFASLVLVTNSLRAQNLSKAKLIRMAGIWSVIIVALVLLVKVFE